MIQRAIDSYADLESIPGIKGFLISRVQMLDVSVGRSEAMDRLAPYHRLILAEQNLGDYPLVTAEQVHGSEIASVFSVDAPFPPPIPEVDGIITQSRGVTLGIYVADCAPVWVVARDGSIGALLHSGKKGTELGIVRNAIQKFSSLGVGPENLMVLIGACIRPPCYEVDFAADILNQAHEEGVTSVHNCGICTACHPDRYYSYRREKGLTGRMLATLTLLP